MFSFEYFNPHASIVALSLKSEFYFYQAVENKGFYSNGSFILTSFLIFDMMFIAFFSVAA